MGKCIKRRWSSREKGGRVKADSIILYTCHCLLTRRRGSSLGLDTRRGAEEEEDEKKGMAQVGFNRYMAMIRERHFEGGSFCCYSLPKESVLVKTKLLFNLRKYSYLSGVIN